jgi:hypothetical protein
MITELHGGLEIVTSYHGGKACNRCNVYEVVIGRTMTIFRTLCFIDPDWMDSVRIKAYMYLESWLALIKCHVTKEQ